MSKSIAIPNYKLIGVFVSKNHLVQKINVVFMVVVPLSRLWGNYGFHT